VGVLLDQALRDAYSDSGLAISLQLATRQSYTGVTGVAPWLLEL
jgi:hypothetical protein